MSVFQAIKNILKRIFPPPTKSFMREMNDLRSHLFAIQEALTCIREENKSLSKALENIREENRNLSRELSSIREENKDLSRELSSIREENKDLAKKMLCFRDEYKKNDEHLEKQIQLCLGKASENVWAEVFNNTITDSTWLRRRAFSPGRWALGYQALYVLYRILNGTKPKCILELGLGQSTNMITQYVASNNDAVHFVVEHDPEWIRFYQQEYSLDERTEIVQLDRKLVPFKEAEAVRVFDRFYESFAGRKYDLIVVDAPLGGDMKDYARIDILSLIPDCLCESFVILIDDAQRPGETKTIEEITSALDDTQIAYAKGNYSGENSCMVICSNDNAFLTSL